MNGLHSFRCQQAGVRIVAMYEAPPIGVSILVDVCTVCTVFIIVFVLCIHNLVIICASIAQWYCIFSNQIRFRRFFRGLSLPSFVVNAVSFDSSPQFSSFFRRCFRIYFCFRSCELNHGYFPLFSPVTYSSLFLPSIGSDSAIRRFFYAWSGWSNPLICLCYLSIWRVRILCDQAGIVVSQSRTGAWIPWGIVVFRLRCLSLSSDSPIVHCEQEVGLELQLCEQLGWMHVFPVLQIARALISLLSSLRKTISGLFSVLSIDLSMSILSYVVGLHIVKPGFSWAGITLKSSQFRFVIDLKNLFPFHTVGTRWRPVAF